MTVDPVTGDLLVVNGREKSFVGLNLQRKESADSRGSFRSSRDRGCHLSTYGVTLFLGIRPAKVYLYKHLAPALKPVAG